jgi:hypothetical protein
VNNQEPITFTKVRFPWGWLSNMSPHPIEYRDERWPTAEHLFQALRFAPNVDYGIRVRDEIRQTKSPMAAKMVAQRNHGFMCIIRCGKDDLVNMRRVLRAKIEQHLGLRAELLSSGDRVIIEDVSARASRGSAMFWGAARTLKGWEGENRLGRMWMDLRDEIRLE